jgi:hypothetical protein
MATLRGETVDRPAVCFYELNGLDEDPTDPDPYTIYSHPSWTPLIDLTREQTDRIVMREIGSPLQDLLDKQAHTETIETRTCRYTVHTLKGGDRILTARTRRDRDTNTIWTEEHLLKTVEDLDAFLSVPSVGGGDDPDPSTVLQTEQILGDTGIVMLDTPDPLCMAASLFNMATFTIIALTEPVRFHQLLDRFASELYPRVQAVSKALPDRLWRIYGPEYASPPYLPPRCFHDYVVSYDRYLVKTIQKNGGYARIHSHGNLHDILPLIAEMKPDGLDPIEPPPQGDVTLADVRSRYGDQMVLFGNIEISDIETLSTDTFAATARQALNEGCNGTGRGFVLMPTACPYGRIVSQRTLTNYQTLVDLVQTGSV